MADTERTQTEPAAQLFDRLNDLRAGMLGVEGSDQHMQPMSHHVDRDTQTLYFITSEQTGVARAVGAAGNIAHFTVQSTSQDYYACMSGPITKSADEAKLDEIWSAIAAAWFEQGRKDKDVVLLEMPLREAAIWSSSRNPFVFGMEILKGNQEGETADIGEHRVINFPAVA